MEKGCERAERCRGEPLRDCEERGTHETCWLHKQGREGGKTRAAADAADAPPPRPPLLPSAFFLASEGGCDAMLRALRSEQEERGGPGRTWRGEEAEGWGRCVCEST